MISRAAANSLLSLVLLGLATSTAAGSPPACQAVDTLIVSRLEVSAFCGSVQNRFSPRPTPGENAEDQTAQKDAYSVFGIQFAYPFKCGGGGIEVFGNIRHGKRQAEQSPATVADGGDFILSSETVEWHGGFKYFRFLGTEGNCDDCPALFIASQFGFASPSDGPGDLIDDHTYYAIGLELRSGRYKDSYMSVGYGSTDIFENTNARKKIEAGLAFHFLKDADDPTSASPHSLMLLGLLDSDWGPGSDDLRIVFGYRLSIDAMLGPK